jgi:hypothetical protein
VLPSARVGDLHAAVVRRAAIVVRVESIEPEDLPAPDAEDGEDERDVERSLHDAQPRETLMSSS